MSNRCDKCFEYFQECKCGIDWNRMNDVLQGKISGRRAGNTTAVLHSVVAHILKGTKNVSVFCRDHQQKNFLSMELRRILKEIYEVEDHIFINPSDKSVMVANTVVLFFTYSEQDASKLRGYVSDFVTDDESPNLIDRIANLRFQTQTLGREIEALENQLIRLQKEQNVVIERLHFENRSLL